MNTVPMCHFKVLCLDLPKVIPQTAVNESGHRAGSKGRSDSSGEHEQSKGCSVWHQLNELELAEGENTLLKNFYFKLLQLPSR